MLYSFYYLIVWIFIVDPQKDMATDPNIISPNIFTSGLGFKY